MRIQKLRITGNKVVKSALETDILLSYVLRKPREFLLIHDEEEVTAADVEAFLELCKARAAGVPVAYLTHKREFFGLEFYVDNRVLIPRPETELVVEETLCVCKELHETKKRMFHPASEVPPLHILDVGTGSGCIAISLAKNLPNAQITAVDISDDALAVAHQNAKNHGVTSKITFLKSDLLADIPDPQFDIILANLPYIGTSETSLVSPETLQYEPHSALFSGETGFELYISLFTQIAALSKKPQFLIAEMGFNQREGLQLQLAHFFPTAHVTWKKDLAGLPRAFILSF